MHEKARWNSVKMDPDLTPNKIHAVGNTSLAGVRALHLDRGILEEASKILNLMTYVQLSVVANFPERMKAAVALPHMDISRFSSVQEELKKIKR